MKSMMKNKRGVVGLEVAQSFILGIMVIAILGFVTLVVFAALNNSGAGDDRTQSYTVSESLVYTVNDSSYIYFPTANSARSSLCTLTTVINGSSLITAANYTVDNCRIIYSNTVANAGINNTVWTANYTYSYIQSSTRDINSNISTGMLSLFSNSPAWFALLAVVIIILIIGIVITVVTRFGGGREYSSRAAEQGL